MPKTNTDQLARDIAQVKDATDSALQDFFTLKIAQARKMDAQYAKLLGDMKRFIAQGGKRLRPFFVDLGYRAAGGTGAEIVPVMAALELYHNFALIHDDIMDQDICRYGGPNIAGIYLKRYQKFHQLDIDNLARSIALLAGDVNYTLVYELITQAKFAADTRLKIIERLTRSMFELGAGQLLDLLAPTSTNLNLAQLRKISLYKTAGYSLSTPLQIGVIAAVGDNTLLAGFEHYAENLGVAFQLQDDVLNFFGDPRVTGKPVFSDLREGKRTVLLYYALQMCSEAEKQFILRTIGREAMVPKRDLTRVQAIIYKTNARARTERLAQSYVVKAKQAAAGLAIPAQIMITLNQMADFIVERRY